LLILNSTKDRFFSIIAHDLRNPFHTVKGFSEILLNDLEKLEPEKIKKYIQFIFNSSTNGSNLLENLLQWSRSQTGSIPFNPAKLNLFELTEEIIKLLEANAHKKNIKIEQLIEPEIVVFADQNMLMTVFRNLISNAIKFTGENGKITLQSHIQDQQIEVSITDSGIGIPCEIIPKLFRIDTNITTKGTSNETGTGLGLILCKEFIEKHKGKIWVESNQNEGSSFKFTLSSI